MALFIGFRPVFFFYRFSAPYMYINDYLLGRLFDCLVCCTSLISDQVVIRYYGIAGSVGTVSNAQSLLVKPGIVPMYNVSRPAPTWCNIQGLTVSGKFICFPKKQKTMLVSCVKTSEAKETAKSNGEVTFNFSVCSLQVLTCLLVINFYSFFSPFFFVG